MPCSVVLVHGLRSAAPMWNKQRKLLTKRGHEVIVPDLPGHGTRMSERFTLDAAIRTIDDAVASASQPVLLVGTSLGGYLAIHFAARTDRPLLGLVASSCGTQPSRLILAGYRALAAIIHAFPDRGHGLHNWMTRRFVPEKESQDDVLAGGVPLDVMADALRELRGLDTRESLRRIDVPVWLVNGRLDHFRLQERSMLKAARRGRLIHIPGGNHLVTLTKWREYNLVLLDAIRELDPTSLGSSASR